MDGQFAILYCRMEGRSCHLEYLEMEGHICELIIFTEGHACLFISSLSKMKDILEGCF